MEEENKKVKKEKKPVTLKTLIIRRIIFILVFALIASGITAFLIIRDPFSSKETEPKLESKQEDLDNDVPKAQERNHVSLINYDSDTFDYNDLKISEISENFENYDIRYYKIDGLKDKSIQDKINNNLENDLKNTIKQAKSDGNLKGNTNIDIVNLSSFANTLSIAYSISSYLYDENTNEDIFSWTKFICENYNLRTGEELKFQDLFTDDTLGSDIFDNVFYNELIYNYVDRKFNENIEDWPYITVENYKDIEEKILETVLKFNEKQEIPFYFDEQEVYLTNFSATSYDSAKIFFEDHLDFVAIYNRYKDGEYIFDGKYKNLHNLPVLTKRFNSDYQVLEEGENYYIDANYIGPNYYEGKITNEAILNSVINYINSDVESIKSAQNDGKFHVYNSVYSLSNLGTYCALDIAVYKKETTKSLFNSELKPQIQNLFRKAQRISAGEDFLYNNLFVEYLYIDDEDSFDTMKKEWEKEEYSIFLDNNGNIYETEEEVRNPDSIPVKD